MRHWLIHSLSWFALVFSTISSAGAEDHIVERAWSEDVHGEWRLSDVLQISGELFEDTLSRGFGESVIWIRLRIDPHAHPLPNREPGHLFLRIRPVYLDQIEVFDSLAPGGLAGVTGDRHHPRQTGFQSLDFVVPIARGEATRDVWLRLESTSTRQIDVQALNIETLDELSQRQSLVSALYVGFVLIFVVWAFVYWFFGRDTVVGGFGVAQLNAFFFALCSLGYLRTLWPASWSAELLNAGTSIFSVLSVSSAVLFHALLQREFSPPRWVKSLHACMLALLPIKLCLLMAGATVTGLQLNMAEVLLAPMVFLISVLASRGWDVTSPDSPALSRKVMISFYALLIGMLTLAALPGLGFISGGEITLYIVQAHGLVTGFLVLTLLQYRAHIMRKRHGEAALKLEKMELEARHERAVREEQEMLFNMLAHELKTPLAIMELRIDNQSAGSQELRNAIRDMNGVVERCVQSSQLSEKSLILRHSVEDLTKLVEECISGCVQPSRVKLRAPQNVLIVTDRQLMAIAINNLLENACKYASFDSPIMLEIKQAQMTGTVRLEIRNLPGTSGWPDAERVFDKYYRSPHAKRQTGTGLGLFIVKSLVQALGGKIEYVPDETYVRFLLEFRAVSSSPFLGEKLSTSKNNLA